MKSYFPHNSRIFTATVFLWSGKLLIWFVLAILFVTNISAKLSISPLYWPQVVTALRFPNSFGDHSTLATTLQNFGLTESSQNELAYIATLSVATTSLPNVLGQQTVNEIVEARNMKARSLQQNFSTWQNIVTEKTDYRDGYLILAYLSYERSMYNQSNMYARSALRLDPNSLLAEKIIKITEEVRR